MNNVPNRTHSLVIQEMCERLSLVDPYRVLNPEKREYTYVPRAAGAKNRSRIDFFLISTGIVALNMNCTIADHLQNKLFDHRAVFLDLKKNMPAKHVTGRINNNILKDDITELIIFSSCAEAYALHASPEALPVQEQRNTLRKVGTLKNIIKNAGPPIIPAEELVRDDGKSFRDNRDGLLREAELCKDDINLPHLQNLDIAPAPDIFF
jgi:hypothetical protein